MQKSLNQLLNETNIVFWDFDGVIKDSVKVKSLAFKELFSEYERDVVEAIGIHHEKNGGLSRFEKIPLYLSWTDIPVTNENVKKYCDKFSLLVKQSVIDSAWVPGVLNYLEANYKKKKFLLITATPKSEIDEILKELQISHFFTEVYGAPTSKLEAIRIAMKGYENHSKNAIMIGDSYSDYEAATNNNILFALRQTEFNLSLQKESMCLMFRDFNDE